MHRAGHEAPKDMTCARLRGSCELNDPRQGRGLGDHKTTRTPNMFHSSYCVGVATCNTTCNTVSLTDVGAKDVIC